MDKQQVFEFIEKHGYTGLAVQHPDTPKEWVLEYLDTKEARHEDLKEYFRTVVEANFN